MPTTAPATIVPAETAGRSLQPLPVHVAKAQAATRDAAHEARFIKQRAAPWTDPIPVPSSDAGTTVSQFSADYIAAFILAECR